MPKLRLFATIDLSHNGAKNIEIWEVIYPIRTDKGFDVNPSAKVHMYWDVIKKFVEPIQKNGKCILMQPNSLGWNNAINKNNATDFYFAESINGRHIINIATETLIQEIKEIL